MPPKAKGGAKASAETALDPPPQTVSERSTQRYHLTNPYSKRKEQVGFSSLTPAEAKTYAHAQAIKSLRTEKTSLSNKAEREFWKTVTKENLPLRQLAGDDGDHSTSWGCDRNGRDLGTYQLEEFRQRNLKQLRLATLTLLSEQFSVKRDLASSSSSDISPKDVGDEKSRRKEMATLRRDLYGDFTSSLAQDPLWDDVVPIPQHEPAGALAQIAYPEEYAEVVAYLRAVMAAEECTERALRLTETVISMNPAHYTVWLYRFKILSRLQIPIPDEIEWLNDVSLANLKNYQIWHHRQLLLDYHYPQIASDLDAVKKLARSETAFLKIMLAEDTKNYHVWSYRKYLVEKLGMWNVQEMGAAQNMIEEDVRNNSAWAHRFFLVFSNPAQSSAPPTGGEGIPSKSPPQALPPTAADPKVPGEVIDREVDFSKEKIQLAPQNQAVWNYLRGVLAKGGRPLKEVEAFAGSFVKNLGEGDEVEQVTSSHALDLLAEVYRQAGDREKAELCLRRLWEKWDRVREGYWRYRAAQLEKE